MRRLDLVTAAVVLLLCGFAVVHQLTSAAPERPTTVLPALQLGEAVDPDVGLEDLSGVRRRLGEVLGRRATVLYAWSTTCPCIPWCEEDLQALMRRWGVEQGVAWVAVVGEPTDTPEGVRETAEKLGSPYSFLLDPSHRLCARLGFDRAAVLAVLDADGYLRFRGNMTDRLTDPTQHYLAGVLEAVLAGRRPDPEETPLNYGCAFSAPVACEDDPPPSLAPDGEGASLPE